MFKGLLRILAALLRVLVTLVGVTLAAGLVVLGLTMALVFVLIGRLTGKPVAWRTVRMRSTRGAAGNPFARRDVPQDRRAGEAEVIDIEVREVPEPARRLPDER